MPQIDSENFGKLSFCRFDALSGHFPRAFVISSNTVKMKKNESYAVQYLKSTLQRFASKTLQNDSK